jgi:urate oxidase / 2-oxo-4-hydroxy-4-carboxy-5-ureidoimidazoline decarboxylase
MAELLTIGYGKEEVSVYRTDGISTLFAAEVGMTARGEAFVPSYTEGDNAVVVATDSMKNFIHMHALEYEESSLEGFLELLARRFMDTYAQVERVELHGREVPFARRSEQSFQRVGGDVGVAELALNRDGTLEHRSGREGLKLMKLTGSSFEGFVRDEYTTLPEARDRPLFVHLDVRWQNGDYARRANGELVRDTLVSTFAEFESESIQHLVHEMGTRVLERFPEIDSVSFRAENRLWDTAQEGDGVTIYTDARPPFGVIELQLNR